MANGVQAYVSGMSAIGGTLSNYYGQDMTLEIVAAGNMISAYRIHLPFARIWPGRAPCASLLASGASSATLQGTVDFINDCWTVSSCIQSLSWPLTLLTCTEV